jgi:hypothetical protein
VKHEPGRIGARLQFRFRILAIAFAVAVREHERAVERANDGAAVHAEERVEVRVARDQPAEGNQVVVRRTSQCLNRKKNHIGKFSYNVAFKFKRQRAIFNRDDATFICVPYFFAFYGFIAILLSKTFDRGGLVLK